MRSDRFFSTMAAGFLAGALALATAAPCAQAQQLVSPTLRGGTFNLAAKRGHVVLVNFWATWCPPCRAEIPALNAFYSRHRGQGLEIVGVSTDPGRDREEVVKMAGGISYTVLMARDATENSFGSPGGLPVTYVIDRQGNVRTTMRPDSMPVNAHNLEAVVGPVLGGR